MRGELSRYQISCNRKKSDTGAHSPHKGGVSSPTEGHSLSSSHNDSKRSLYATQNLNPTTTTTQYAEYKQASGYSFGLSAPIRSMCMSTCSKPPVLRQKGGESPKKLKTL